MYDDLFEPSPQEIRAKKRRRTVVVGALLNLVVIGGLLAAPAFRARSRAEDAQARFADFAACLFDASRSPSPGLAFPPGERLRFATLALTDERVDWPSRCRPALERVAPEDAWFLFPGARGQELAVRVAVGRVAEQLDAFARDGRPVPEGPLVAVELLRSVLVEWAKDVSASFDPAELAFELRDQRLLAEPARVPIGTLGGAIEALEVRGDGLEIVAMDGQMVSYTEVGGGQTGIARIPRRRRPLRAIVQGPSASFAVFATNPERCAGDRCVGRQFGLMKIGEREVLPQWFSAHPGGAHADAIAVAGEHVFAIAATADPAFSRVELALAPEWKNYEGEDEAEPELRAPLRTVPLAGTTPDSRIALDDRFALFTAPSDNGPRWHAMRAGETVAVPLEVAGEPELCRSFAVFFEPGSFRVAHLESQRISAPVPLVDPGEKEIVCDDAHVIVVATRAEQPVSITRCSTGGECTPIEGAPEAAHVGAAYEEGALLVAVSDGGLVRVARLEGDRLEHASVVAPCWDSDDGLCGPPRVAVRNGRFVVATPARGELRVIETTDQGRTFRAMRGIR
jgi:hypothetical protein